MPRAKSRLSSSSIKKSKAKTRLNKASKKPAKTKTSTSSKKIKLKPILLNYLKHLPTLLLGIFFSGLTYYILTRVQPSAIQHFILPNSYFPLLISVFLAVFFISGFIFLNSRRGFLLSTATLVFLFLRVQQIALNPETIAIILLPLLIIESIYSLVNRRADL